MIDLRRRPKRSASDATPRILLRFRRGLVAVEQEEESAVAGRESEAVREDLFVKGTMSSRARELAEVIRRISEPVGGRAVAITRGAGSEAHRRARIRASRKHHAPCPWGSILH